MTDQEPTQEELDEQNGEPLPDREVMSVITPIGDPDVPLDVPKVADQEPGLPPPRD